MLCFSLYLVYIYFYSALNCSAYMGIGGSITASGETFTSYLGPLAHLLDGAGFDYEFVGAQDGCSAGVEYKHAAFGGKNVEYVNERIDSIYQEYPADIVLIHAGHNHFIEENPVQGIVNAYLSIIQKVKKINPNAVILVAGVIESGKLPKYRYLADLNVALNKLVITINDGFDWRIHTIQDRCILI